MTASITTTKDWLDTWQALTRAKADLAVLPPLPAPAGVLDVAALLAWRATHGLSRRAASQEEIDRAVRLQLADQPHYFGYREVTTAALSAAEEFLAQDAAAQTGLVVRYRDSRDGKRWERDRDGRVLAALDVAGLPQSHPLRRIPTDQLARGIRVILGETTGPADDPSPLRWYSTELAKDLTAEWERDRRADLEAGIRR